MSFQRSLRVFAAYYRPYRRTLFLDLLCALVMAVVTLVYPLCAGYITRTVLHQSGTEATAQLLQTGGLMVGLLALQLLANTYIDFQGHMMGTLIERDMRRDLFAHLQRLSFTFYDRYRTGQLMSRVTNDLYNVGELAHHGPEDLFIALVMFLGVFGILFGLNPALTLLLFCFVPFMAAYALFFNVRLNRAMLKSRQRIGEINAQVEDSLSGIRVVQSFVGEAREQARFDAANALFVDSRRDGYRAEAFYYQGMLVFTQLMTISVLVFGGLGILRGGLPLDQLVVYLLCVGLLMEPIRRFVNLTRLLQEGLTGFQRFREMIEVQPDLQDALGAVPLENVGGDVQFRDVIFGYGSHTTPVLQHLDLSIRAGEYVALVGASGAGKSTLCALIPRFYDVTGGEVRVDGMPVRQLTLDSLRRSIGVVQQDVYLFAGTVGENIRYGRPEASEAEIIRAAQQAGAHDFITALPQGYQTDIGQRGVRLSGGQKQRLSLARVFLKDPPILIFDEATSALDHETERVVQEALDKLAQRRTTIVIAHRLSTIRHTHRIIVLGEGRVLEEGTHEELLRRGSAYAQLYMQGARV